MSKIKCEINDLYILSERKSGDVKTFSKISWNGGKESWNIRKYNTESGTMFKGIALNEMELDLLTEILVEKGFGDKGILVEHLEARKNETENKIENFEAIFEDSKNSGYDITLKGGMK